MWSDLANLRTARISALQSRCNQEDLLPVTSGNYYKSDKYAVLARGGSQSGGRERSA